MNVLVTGRDGQVARCLAEAAVESGIQLHAVGRPALDLREATSVAHAIARHRPDVVINAAAYTQVDKAERDEATAFAVNAAGAEHVAQACAAHDIPLIQVSTDFVFDGQKREPYRETDPTGPLNVYGCSKLEGERRIAQVWSKHLIVRTSWVYSPYGSNFVLTMLRLARQRAVIEVVDDQHGCPTYALHLAKALLGLARIVGTKPADVRWGVYHAAGQGETTWCAFANQVFAEGKRHGLPVASATPIFARDYPTLATRPLNSRLDCTALDAAYAIRLPDWQSGLRDCMARVAADRTIFQP